MPRLRRNRPRKPARSVERGSHHWHMLCSQHHAMTESALDARRQPTVAKTRLEARARLVANGDNALRRIKRVGTGLCFVLFPAVWIFAFAVHPNLLQPRLLLGPEQLIQRAHGNNLLQFAHVLVTLNAALLVPMAIHFMKLLERTRAARAGVLGACLAILGAFLLAADKGPLCLTMSAVDTLPESAFAQLMPGLLAIFSFKGLMALLWGFSLMPIGVMIQTVGMWKANVLPAWRSGLLLVSLLLIGFPDGAEIINLTAAVALAAALLPCGFRLMQGADVAIDSQMEPNVDCHSL